MKNYFMPMIEGLVIGKIDNCSNEQLHQLINKDFVDDDHYGVIDDKESVKSYFECVCADDDEYIEAYRILE